MGEIRGLDPEFTSGLSSAEYLKQRWCGHDYAALRADALALAAAVERFEVENGNHARNCPAEDGQEAPACACGYRDMMRRARALRERWGRG